MKFGKSEEEKAAREAEREAAREAKEYERYLKTPVGLAEAAFGRGDRLFQCSFSMMSQQAIVVKMVGAKVRSQSSDPSEILNAIAAQGWEIVSASHVFIEQGSESRDKFMSSGQNIAVKGEVMGYYVFRRNEANRNVDDETPAVASV